MAINTAFLPVVNVLNKRQLWIAAPAMTPIGSKGVMPFILTVNA
jgi:hypothetical protein